MPDEVEMVAGVIGAVPEDAGAVPGKDVMLPELVVGELLETGAVPELLEIGAVPEEEVGAVPVIGELSLLDVLIGNGGVRVSVMVSVELLVTAVLRGMEEEAVSSEHGV